MVNKPKVRIIGKNSKKAYSQICVSKIKSVANGNNAPQKPILINNSVKLSSFQGHGKWCFYFKGEHSEEA